MTTSRLSTGVSGLDELLGGGLLPGTLTVLVGATGIGKTQFSVQFLNAGQGQEGHRGVIFDMTARGDSQSHADYARRMFGWKLTASSGNQRPDLEHFFAHPGQSDYLHVFDVSGRRVTRRDLDFDAWNDRQAELNARLEASIGFLYGNFVRGVRRVAVDGVEPVDRPGDSIQFELFEYLYHQVIRKAPEWVARDLFRQDYRCQADQVAAHVYDPSDLGCVLSYTSHQSMLEELISRPLDEGDLLSNANTVIYLGRVPLQGRLQRALYIAKHRGSACHDGIVPLRIDDAGLHVAQT